jgi:hypothetical protein
MHRLLGFADIAIENGMIDKRLRPLLRTLRGDVKRATAGRGSSPAQA